MLAWALPSLRTNGRWPKGKAMFEQRSNTWNYHSISSSPSSWCSRWRRRHGQQTQWQRRMPSAQGQSKVTAPSSKWPTPTTIHRKLSSRQGAIISSLIMALTCRLVLAGSSPSIRTSTARWPGWSWRTWAGCLSWWTAHSAWASAAWHATAMLRWLATGIMKAKEQASRLTRMPVSPSSAQMPLASTVIFRWNWAAWQ